MLMENYNNFDSLLEGVYRTISESNKKASLIYAYNTTWKTRLSRGLTECINWYEENKKAISYNDILEDIFYWEDDILKYRTHHWIIQFIKDNWLENDISRNFQKLLNTWPKLDAEFNWGNSEIYFNIVWWDDQSQNNIKISKWEHSIFIWILFYTVLEAIKNTLSEKQKGDYSFDDLRYIIIDDPVSSIDDTKIIDLAVKLAELIGYFNNFSINFIITTHHTLFFNVLYNNIKNNRNNTQRYILKRDKYNYDFFTIKKPFCYHLYIKKILEDAIKHKNIERYHFNLLRNILEKTVNFMWYRNIEECLKKCQLKEELISSFKQKLNSYSHAWSYDLEYKEINEDEKEIFIEVFQQVNTYFYKI